MKALWLASWFPNRTNTTTGDFIERHALAVAPFMEKLFVISVVKDESLAAGKIETEKKQQGNLFIYTAYYGRGKYSALFEKIYSYRKYLSLQKKLFNEIVAEHGMIDIVHVHVAMKAGLFAKELKRKYQLSYLVTEHWTGYFKACSPNVYDMGIIYRELNTSVLKNAVMLLPVSEHLGKTIIESFANIPFKVVPNVTDTNLFCYQQAAANKFRFIHPSYMNYQKNPEGILQACKLLAGKEYNFELLMVGNDDKQLQQIADETGLLNKYVFFKPAVPHNEVAALMQQSSALLLFSRFENLPCVIIEALCCGLPVISTRVGGIHEVINEYNGILVENENVDQLTTAMQQVIDNYNLYNRNKIAEEASAKFNYGVVGKQHAEIYKSILQKN